MNAVKLTFAAMFAVIVLLAGSTANINGNAFGNPKAPVMIEVFSDFQCPGCKGFHDGDLPHIMADYVSTGKVYLVYRYFPLQMHTYGRACAEYAAAAARVGRWQKVSDALFAHQADITKDGNVEAVVDAVLTPTEAKTVNSLIKSPEVQREIETDVAEGTQIPVRFTPTLLVTAHGKSEPVSWPLNYNLFKQYVDALVGK